MRYKQEFPRFDDELPMIDGFFDCSWHNDACPSIMSYYDVSSDQYDGQDKPYIQIFIDYKDKKLSDFKDIPRYTIFDNVDPNDPNGNFNGEVVLQSDSWIEVLNKVKELKNG
jgi:hypothetical protein